MYIVVNNIHVQALRSVKEFKLDLGMSLVPMQNDAKRTVIDIKDYDVLNYTNTYERICYKVGTIGILNIYTDSRLSYDSVAIWKTHNEEKKIDVERFREDTRNYIAELLQDDIIEPVKLTVEEKKKLWLEQNYNNEIL